MYFVTITGTVKYLREYETLRQRSNVPKLVGIDLIQKVAGNKWSPLLIATNTALQVTDAIPILKVSNTFLMKIQVSNSPLIF